MNDICHRYFYALQPSPAKLEAIAAHRDAFPGGYSHVSDERIHLTVAVTHDFDKHDERIVQVLKAIGNRAAVDPFRVTLDRISGSSNPDDKNRGSIALRASRKPAGLSDLNLQLSAPMGHWGLLRDGWSLHPHTTLLYWQGQPFLRPIQPISWLAIELVLIHSIVGETEHIECGRWRLESDQHSLRFG